MYNRYVPQSDGSYRRNRVQEHKQEPSRPPETPCQSDPPKPIPQPPAQDACQQESHKPSTPPQGSVSGFLRQLLPKDFDTGDLLVILLLLLMAGDCEEDQNTALLTLALYLFM